METTAEIQRTIATRTPFQDALSHPLWRLLQREDPRHHLHGGLARVVVDALLNRLGAYMKQGRTLLKDPRRQ